MAQEENPKEELPKEEKKAAPKKEAPKKEAPKKEAPKKEEKTAETPVVEKAIVVPEQQTPTVTEPVAETTTTVIAPPADAIVTANLLNQSTPQEFAENLLKDHKSDELPIVEEKKEAEIITEKNETVIVGTTVIDGKEMNVVETVQREALSDQARKWAAYLKLQGLSPEKFLAKYPNHPAKKFVEEIVGFQQN